jgi:hypothetical protein
MSQLVRCKNCDQIFMRSPFDELPEYRLGPGLSPENFQAMEKDDFKDFLSNHQGHQLEDLDIIEDSYVSEGAYSEPVKTSFLKATNGKEKFVVKKSRERIDEPLKYELVSGDYHLECVAVGIRSDEILKQMAREMSPFPSQDRVDAFLKLMGTLVKDIEIQDLERIPEESHHPLEIYYKLDDLRIMYLLRNCRRIFKGQEYSAIEAFIHRHKDDGVLLLKATYKIQITQRAKTRKRPASSPLPLEKQELLKQK